MREGGRTKVGRGGKVNGYGCTASGFEPNYASSKYNLKIRSQKGNQRQNLEDDINVYRIQTSSRH